MLTQYKAHSLIQHLQRGWNFLDADLEEFIDVVPAQQRRRRTLVRRHGRRRVPEPRHPAQAAPRYVLVLAGDHVYKMDYGVMLAEHAERGADVTVACLEVPLDDGLGLRRHARG